MSSFSSIEIGQSSEFTHTVEQADIDRFVDLSGDNNRLHVDQDFCARTEMKRPVAHGMLGAAFISRLIGTRLPGDGALWCSQNLRFLLPVRVGDKLLIKAEVISKNERSQTIEIRTDILNQFNEKVTTGLAEVKILDIQSDEIEQKQQDQGTLPKVALVIGGSGGIGAAACLALARDGFDIAFTYRTQKEKADKVQQEIQKIGRQAIALELSLTDTEGLQRVVETVLRSFRQIGVFVNCASPAPGGGTFDSTDWGMFEQELGVVLKGTFDALKMIVPKMVEQGAGRIILMSSQFVDAPEPKLIPYTVSKAALATFASSLAVELAPKGVLVNMVSPGPTETDMLANIPEKIRLVMAAKTPARRLALPEDVAGAISFLASDRADYLVGETIRINGGAFRI